MFSIQFHFVFFTEQVIEPIPTILTLVQIVGENG